MSILRRLRGVIGMAVMWGVAFAVLAAVVVVICVAAGAMSSSKFGPRQITVIAGWAALAGGLAGMLFATVLGGIERRQTLTTLSTGRVALWGFLSAVWIPFALTTALHITALLPRPAIVVGSVLVGTFGAAIGMLAVRVARRGIS